MRRLPGLLSGIIFAGAAHAQVMMPPSPFWRDVRVETQGAACRAALEGLRERVRAQPTTSFLVARSNMILFHEGPINRPVLVRSIRKSLMAMLYGRPVEEGRIQLDETLQELGVDDIGGLLPIEKQARVLDLLTSRSGVYHPAANPGDDAAAAPARGSQTPGTYFLYNNWDFNVAGDIFEQRAKRNLYDAFDKDIAGPLGLEDFDRARHHRGGDPKRSSHLSYPFYLSARDLARLGLLMLGEGQWRFSPQGQDRAQGLQLVPRDWVRRIITPVTSSAQMHPPHVAQRRLSYGLMWWMPEVEAKSPLSGAYFAWGYFGQWLLVVPRRQMVIVHLFETKAREDGAPAASVRLREFLSQARTVAEAPCE